jgi:hypothetical protein
MNWQPRILTATLALIASTGEISNLSPAAVSSVSTYETDSAG